MRPRDSTEQSPGGQGRLKPHFTERGHEHRASLRRAVRVGPGVAREIDPAELPARNRRAQVVRPAARRALSGASPVRIRRCRVAGELLSIQHAARQEDCRPVHGRRRADHRGQSPGRRHRGMGRQPDGMVDRRARIGALGHRRLRRSRPSPDSGTATPDRRSVRDSVHPLRRLGSRQVLPVREDAALHGMSPAHRSLPRLRGGNGRSTSQERPGVCRVRPSCRSLRPQVARLLSRLRRGLARRRPGPARNGLMRPLPCYEPVPGDGQRTACPPNVRHRIPLPTMPAKPSRPVFQDSKRRRRFQMPRCGAPAPSRRSAAVRPRRSHSARRRVDPPPSLGIPTLPADVQRPATARLGAELPLGGGPARHGRQSRACHEPLGLASLQQPPGSLRQKHPEGARSLLRSRLSHGTRALRSQLAWHPRPRQARWKRRMGQHPSQVQDCQEPISKSRDA